jgi:hypothetical protein
VTMGSKRPFTRPRVATTGSRSSSGWQSRSPPPNGSAAERGTGVIGKWDGGRLPRRQDRRPHRLRVRGSAPDFARSPTLSSMRP